MCTAVAFSGNDHYFGRNLDLEYSYSESVTITPRNYPLQFKCGRQLINHYAMIGMAYVVQGYPLYYDATNEKGLSIAGLNFPGNAVYLQPEDRKEYIAPFEMIPWILGQCASVDEAKELMNSILIADLSFSDQLPVAPLHWLVADHDQSITIEPLEDGIKIYDNPVGVLTNNPPFDYHMHHLTQYMNITSDAAKNRFAPSISLEPFSKGMGGIGLPGDLSSSSRFVRAAFMKLNSVCNPSEAECVSQFFHILGSVEQQRGCARGDDDLYEITHYTSCCNADRGIYYYRTYSNSQITAVDMHHEDLDTDRLTSYPLINEQQIKYQN